MLKLGRVTKVKVVFLLLVFVFNFDLFKFSAAILEKGLYCKYLIAAANYLLIPGLKKLSGRFLERQITK